MPSREEEIHHYHTLVEENLKDILQRFKYYLSRGDGRNRAQLVEELDTLLEEALRLAIWITQTTSFTRLITIFTTLR